MAPDLLALHRDQPERWPCLLDSATGDGGLGRWSMLLYWNSEFLALDNPGNSGTGFLDRLDDWWKNESPRLAPAPSELPFAGGWFLYLGYELSGEIEPSLRLKPARDRMPVAYAGRSPAALLYDHRDQAAWLTAETESLGLELLASLEGCCISPFRDAGEPLHLDLVAEPGEDFTAGVRRIREYILSGDVFQVNLSRGWTGRARDEIDHATLYHRLARSNAAPFAGLMRLPGGAIVSSSPERLVECNGGFVQTRPIAGTRPRGSSADRDACLSAELIAHPKERAEHIMLIDLERNDLGRVCETGSVEVSELMVVESYTHVHHIVSNIRGRLRPGITPVNVIRAVFPGGTITGCPKVRCMEIIAELEQAGRGFYTGAMGYLGLSGHMDLNILIRSMRVSGNEISFRTGAGIVSDSDPDAELAETESKALGLLRALGHD